jgi:hypothetical protein
MTDTANEVLPEVIAVTQAFTTRLPSQRLIDQLARLEMDVPFPELAQNQPFRIIAFRKLLADHPDRDPTSLWMHAYDVEVDVVEADPTRGSEPTLTLPSALTGTASPSS